MLDQETEPTREPLPAPAGINSIITLQEDISELEHLPDGPIPYFIQSKDGMYVHKRMLIGRAFLPSNPPQTLGGVGNLRRGYFEWNAPKIPATLCSQIYQFFKRIWLTKHAEAEVLLTFNPDTREWRVFVPTQKVSTGGVRSVYEPEHIDPRFIIVGTMHSHCNFGAFHSSTDVGDATDGEGIHLTIGYVDRKEPQVVAMVMINGQQFDFRTADTVADFSNLEASTAPEWWDNYVGEVNSKKHPIGAYLFDKYNIPNPPAGRYGNYNYGGQNVGYENRRPLWEKEEVKTLLGDLISNAADDKKEALLPEENKPGWWTKNKQVAERLGIPLLNSGKKNKSKKKKDQDEEDVYFSTDLPDKVVATLIDSGLLTEEDLESAKRQGQNADLSFYRLLFMRKYAGILDSLNALGLSIGDDDEGRILKVTEIENDHLNKKKRSRKEKNKQRIN